MRRATRLVPALAALLAASCDGTARLCETGARGCSTFGTTAGTTPTTPATPRDTGQALWWYTGGAKVQDGQFKSGYFGTDITPAAIIPDLTPSLCTATGRWTD